MTESRGAMKWSKYSDSDQEYVTLNNGVQMPLLGLGTSGGSGEECEKAVRHALSKGGYKHIDTAAMYGNEQDVGKGIKVVDRKNVFITSKLKNDDHGRVEEAVKEQLEALQTDYIDLYLMHWPVPRINPGLEETWRGIEKMHEQGYLKAIGVSNFSIKKLKDLQSYAKIQPAVNQVEVHVWHRNNPIVEYCLQSGIQIQAYSPMGATPNWTQAGEKGKDPPNTDATVNEVAKKYGKTPNQVLLRWNLQHGSCVIPKSTNPQRIEENAGIWDWSLSKEDYEKISNIDFQVRMCDGEKQGFIKDGPYESVADLWDGES